jgi:cob(I)alamin adenosyltransferase
MNWRELTIKYVKDLLRAKTPLEVVQKELVEAQLAKLQAETSVEYSQAIVNYNEQRISRLNKRINELQEFGHE